MENDLISRSALRAVVGEDINRCYRLGVGSVGPLTHFLEQIDSAPAIDAEPVRHGRWEQSAAFVRCSECLVYWCVREKMSLIHIAKEDLKYCPNCGAKMDAQEGYQMYGVIEALEEAIKAGSTKHEVEE